MTDVKLSDVKQNLKNINCKLKSLMDGTWSVIEPKGVKVVLPTLEAVHQYYLEKTGSKNASPQQAPFNQEAPLKQEAPQKQEMPTSANARSIIESEASIPAYEPLKVFPKIDMELIKSNSPTVITNSINSSDPVEIDLPIEVEENDTATVSALVDIPEDIIITESRPKLADVVSTDTDQWRLQAVGNWLAGQIFVLKGKTIIGRDSNCTITIPGGHLSRRHAEFLAYGSTLKVKDLASSNGCYVNGKQVKESLLKDGDEIKLDVLVFKVLAPEKQTAVSPVVASKAVPEIVPVTTAKEEKVDVDFLTMPNTDQDKTKVLEKFVLPPMVPPSAPALAPSFDKNNIQQSPKETPVSMPVENKIPAPVAKPAVVGSTQISDDQKRAIVAVNAFIYFIKEDRLQKGLNFIHSDIRKFVLFNGCPEALLDKAMNYAESKLYKECMDKVLIKRPFENHLGQKDVMYFDARYAATLGLMNK